MRSSLPRTAGVHARRPLLAAAALLWNALVSAADSEFGTGAPIPVLHWMFTFVPALLIGLAARGLGAARRSPPRWAPAS